MQPLLAALAFLAAIGAWRTSGKSAWLLGAILIVTVIPFTLLAILPTNKKLLDPSLDRNSDSARQLLIRLPHDAYAGGSGQLQIGQHQERRLSVFGPGIFVGLLAPNPRHDGKDDCAKKKHYDTEPTCLPKHCRLQP